MHTAHDRLFQFTFRHAHHAAGWLRSVLPTELASAFDWPRLLPIRERFPGVRARPHAADSAFVATLRIGGHDRDVLLPAEHKSFDDPDLALQLLRYSIHLQRALQSGPGRCPFVLPVVLQHGRRRAASAAVPEDALLGALREFQPRQRYIVDDLAAVDEAAIARRGLTPLAELTLLCLRQLPHEPAHTVPAAFLRWQRLLRAVDRADAAPQAPPIGADAVDAIGWYALAVTDVESLRLAETFARILNRDERSIMSTLERTFQKGRETGKAEGRADTLLLLLAQRFGALDAEIEARVRRGSSVEVDRWIRRVLDAPSLASVFAVDGD